MWFLSLFFQYLIIIHLTPGLLDLIWVLWGQTYGWRQIKGLCYEADGTHLLALWRQANAMCLFRAGQHSMWKVNVWISKPVTPVHQVTDSRRTMSVFWLLNGRCVISWMQSSHLLDFILQLEWDVMVLFTHSVQNNVSFVSVWHYTRCITAWISITVQYTKGVFI